MMSGKNQRQEAVAKIMADSKLTGEQKARKISNLIKMTTKPQEAKKWAKQHQQ